MADFSGLLNTYYTARITNRENRVLYSFKRIVGSVSLASSASLACGASLANPSTSN